MVKLVIFCISLFTLGAVDIAVMRKSNLKREIVPYMIIAVGAGLAAVQYFMTDGAVMGHILRLFGGSV